MIKLKDLNIMCKNRKVAKDFPGQIICRLFGNSVKPCQLDKICEPCEKEGLWYFYSAVLIFFTLAFTVVFWLLRLTKLSKLTYPIAMFFIIPLEWLATCGAASIRFIRKLPL